MKIEIVLCWFGFHRFPPEDEKEPFDVFRYLSRQCERCGKPRRKTGGPIGSGRA